MANKRIQDLEQTTDLTNDDLIPLDTTKKTFATTLKSLTEWLKNTFQTKDNLEQALSDATDKYPSSKVLKDESSRIMTAMDTKVNKSGDTMTGTLLFTSGDVARKNNDYAWNESPTSNIYYATSEFLDKNGDRIGVWELAKNADQNNSMNVIVRTPAGWDGLRVYGSTTEGKYWATIPHSNKNNSIVTTVSLSSGYVRFGNGIQICFGNSAVNQVITFQQPFKDAGYKVGFCQTDNAEHNINNTAVNKTTSSFKFNRGYQGDWIAIGYWY